MKILSKIYNGWIIGSALGVWIALVLIPNGFIPDLFHLEKVISSGTFGRILLSFTSLFGLLVSVLVLTYGFFREKFRRLALKEFLGNPYSNVLITSFITLFMIDVASAIYLDGADVDNNKLNVAYFSLLLSFIYLIGFIPVAFFSIAFSDSQHLISKYLKELKLDHFPQQRSHELHTIIDETNPWSVMISLARRYAENDDFHSVHAIIFSTQQTIQELIGSSTNRQQIGRFLSGQSVVWNAITHKAIQKKEYKVVESIFIAFQQYHSHFSDKKIPLLYLEELKLYERSSIEKLVKEDAVDVVSRIMMLYQQILEHHFDNSAPAENDIYDIKFMDDNEDSKNELESAHRSGQQIEFVDLQWQKIYSDIPYIFDIILRTAIETKNNAIFDSCIRSLQHLLISGLNSSLGDRQKVMLTRSLIGSYYFNQTIALKDGVIKNTRDIQLFDGIGVTPAIALGKRYAKDILESTSEFLIELYKQDKLDKYSLQVLASTGRNCANKYSEAQSFKDCFKYIMKVLLFFTGKFEVDLGKNYESYKFLRDTVDSYLRFHKMASLTTWKVGEKEEKEDIDGELVAYLEAVLKEFKETPTIEELPVKIRWDDPDKM